MRPPKLLYITHARQDEAWVQGVLIPALGLTKEQYWTHAEDDLAALKLERLERAVQSCRYTLLVASSAARVDQWIQFAGVLAEHLSIEEGKPRLLLVARDFDPDSARARELLPLRQRCLVCLDCSTPEQTPAALAVLAAQLALTTTEEPPTECPYPGLRMFGAGDPGSCFNRTDLFFGRDEESREILEKLRRGGRSLLVGPSGCGKSSLVRARVLPELGHGPDAMAIAVARPGAYPDLALRAALDTLDPWLVQATDAYLGAHDKQAAFTVLVAQTAGPRRLLYVDQLEEVFLDDADAHGERARFFARLAVLGRVPGVAILLGMRADFYGDLMRSPAWEEFKDHRVELAPLRGDALRQAITRPAEAVGVHVEADLVERLVREADMDRAAEALPLLQVALEQLWRHREWRYLSLSSYARIAEGQRRGLDVVLARHADASITRLVEPMRMLAHRVLIDLVHLGEGRPDTRRRRTASELRRAGDDAGALSWVLGHLSAQRLIAVGAEASTIAAAQVVAPPSAEGEPRVIEPYIDLAHDTLITGWPALAGWIAERRDALRTQRRLEARAAGGGLLAASELPEFTRWVAWIETPAGQALGTSEALRALVRRSVAARRLRRAAFGVGLATAVTVAIVFGLQTMELREERTKTQRSINEAVKVADLMAFEIDYKLQRVAGASPVRENLQKQVRDLLAQLHKLGELDERGRRVEAASKVVEGDFALERGRIKEARALYLEALADAERRAADPTDHESQRDLSVTYGKLGNIAVSAGKLGEARGWFDKAVAVGESLVAADPAAPRRRHDLANDYSSLGTVAAAAGKLDEARGWLDKALAIHRALVAADPAHHEWQHGLAVCYGKLGGVAVATGKLDEARSWFDKALAGTTALSTADPANALWRRNLSVVQDELGEVAMKAGKLDEARSWFDKALAIHAALSAADPANTDWKRNLSQLHDRLGDVAAAAGKLGEARSWFEKSLAIRTALSAADLANTTWQHDLSVSHGRLGDVAVVTGKIDEARDWFQKSLAVLETLIAADPANATWQRDLAVGRDKLGDAAVKAGKLDEARSWFKQSLVDRERLVATDPSNANWRHDLLFSYSKLGELAVATGKLDEARGWFEKAGAMGAALTSADSANTLWRRDLSYLFINLGQRAVSSGKLDEGRAWFEKALAIREALAASDPANTSWQHDLSGVRDRLGSVAMAAGRLDEARGWFEKTRAALETLTAADPTNSTWRRDLSVSYDKLGDVAVETGKLDAARGWFEKALAVRKLLSAADPRNTEWQRDLSASYEKLGNVAVTGGRLDEARGWAEQTLAVRKALTASEPTNTTWKRDLSIAYNKLGEVAMEAGRLAEAKSWFEQALAVRETLTAADPANATWKGDLSTSYGILGGVAMTAGRLDEARGWFQKSLAIRRALAAADPGNARRQRELCVILATLADVMRDPAEARRYLDEAHVIYDRLQRGGHFQGDADFARIGETLKR